MNLPNSITIARIALVPLFIFLLLVLDNQNSVERWVAIVVFVVAISTDGLDGAIARKTNTVTNLGKILDPIADKALLSGALITLSWLGEISWWITGLILARELAVTWYRAVLAKQIVIAATLAGKLKTIFQGVAVGAVLAPFEIWVPLWAYVEQGLLLIALASTLVSGVQFFMAASKK